MEEPNKPLREFAQSVSLKSEQVAALEPALLERLNELVTNPFKRYMLRDLINQMGVPGKTFEALQEFLELGPELQDQMIKYANQVVLLLKYVMPLDRLLAQEPDLRDELMEWGREVKKLVHDYHIPLDNLLALESEQRSELIMNANYFTKILQQPENVRFAEDLLRIGRMGLTEKQAQLNIEEATQQLRGAGRRLLLSLGEHLPAEVLINIAAASRGEILSEKQATRIVEDAIIEKPESPRSPRK
ncbi:MAG TPA: hypothetical protein VGV92_04025 [Gammaproteobacteria bacterium]|nr:hypothetical protein [Gammaproteobacteria bacterium]